MTTLVGMESEGRVVIGGDCAATAGSRVVTRVGGKVGLLAPNLAIGYAGSTRAQQIIRTHLVLPPLGGLEDDPEDWLLRAFIPALRGCFAEAGWLERRNERERAEETHLLLGVCDQLFAVWTDFQVERSTHGFHAMGSGSEVARGAMFALSGMRDYDAHGRLAEALVAAGTFDAYTRGPFSFESTRGRDCG